MKKTALVLSLVASAFVLAGCANKGTDQTAMNSDNSQMVSKHRHHHYHHDYKGEANSK
jgi:Ni/Co efflux regulator RcnB